MSDTLFGGADSLSAIQSNLQNVMEKIKDLTTVVKQRNPTNKDAIMMQGECPSGLVGCHPAKLNEASGGLLNCPTAEHLPDPIILNDKGQFCYAPKAIRDVLDGKDLNIQNLQKKYSEKILEMLKDGQNLAVAVQSLTTTAPASSFIINIFSNNNYVRLFAVGTDEGKDRLAAILTRYSNSLNAYTGGTFVSRILQEDAVVRAPVGILDSNREVPLPDYSFDLTDTSATFPVRSRRIARAPLRPAGAPGAAFGTGAAGFPPREAAAAASPPGFGAAAAPAGALSAAEAAAAADAFGGGETEIVGGGIHYDIATILLASMVLTYADVTKKAEIVKLIDALGLVFDFDGKNLGVLPKEDTPTTNDIARYALEFLPNPLKRDLDDLSNAAGLSTERARGQMEIFVQMSFHYVFRELYNKKDLKYISALLVLQNSYKTMRDKELEARNLQDKRKRGDDITKTQVDEIVRVQKAARRDYVLAARSFNRVLIEIDNYPNVVIPLGTGSTLKDVATRKISDLYNAGFATPEFDTFIAGLDASLIPARDADRSDVLYERNDFAIPDAPSISPTTIALKESRAASKALEGFRGGDFEPIDGGELDDAFLGLVGGATPPEHFMPKEITDVGKDHEGVIDEALKKKFKSLGYGDIPVFYAKKCPVYATDNNTLGPNRTWIATKHPWAKCQELLGYQMVSEEGYCYPQGAYCYPEDDVVTVTKKTVQAVDAWLSTAKLYNSIMKKKYDSFLEAETARIQAQQPDLTPKEVEELAISHMPSELQPLSEYAATTSLVLTSTSFNEAVSQITNSSDVKQREAIRKILFETLSLSEEWVDDNQTAQNNKLDVAAKRLVDDAKDCTEASLLAAQKISPENLPLVMAEPGANLSLFEPGADQETWSKSADKCEAVKVGAKSTDLLLIPKEVNARFDAKKAEKGEANDPVVAWWRMYYGAKADEQATKLRNISKSLSPFETKVHKPDLADVSISRNKTGQQLYDDLINKAVQ